MRASGAGVASLSTAESAGRPGTAAGRAAMWGAGLFEELFPVQPEPNVPVLLTCDDEVVRVVGERLGYTGIEAARCFPQDVKVAWSIGSLTGFKYVTRGGFERQPRPRCLPDFFPVLCVWVLAASRMAADDRFPTSEYYGRLRGLLALPGDDSLPFAAFMQPLFERFSGWLAEDLAGARGRLILPESPHPRYVGLGVSQTVFRRRDREVLSRFFVERLGSVDGFDPLRRLRRWPGRHQLTGHALRLLDDDAVSDRVRAAIRAALNSWDGAELVDAGHGPGRLWSPAIHLLPHPKPRLHLGAGNVRPLEVSFGDEAVTLDPGAEAVVPWTFLERMRTRAIVLGDPTGDAGGIRVPQLGDSVLFELTNTGLLRVERPTGQSVWVLTRDGALQVRLDRWRFRDRGVLPDWWQLFRDVPLVELPEFERAIAPPGREPLRLTGGLRLEWGVYLSGHSPLLEAGDLELEGTRLPVHINDDLVGSIGSGEQLRLPATLAGSYRVAVGEDEFVTRYDVEETGEPVHGRLSHCLEAERSLRAGARPADGTAGVTVCGAAASSCYEGELPLLVRSAGGVVTIDESGELASHERPRTPAWFAEVGLGESGRWEIFRPAVVWLIAPKPATGRPWAQLHGLVALERLSPEAAGLVLALGEDIRVSSRHMGAAKAAQVWRDLAALAGKM